MTPFVDVAFLILSFFMLATKFKPPEPVEILTPNSVSSDKLEDENAMQVTMDKEGRVYFNMVTTNNELKRQLIDNLNKTRNLGLTPTEMNHYMGAGPIGVPFNQLKSLLAKSPADQAKVKQDGIPVKDSASNELYYWVRDAVTLMAGNKVKYYIKGDNNAKYPDFKNVISAFKRNDIYKFSLITTPEDAPIGSPLWRNQQEKK
ncbi:biopolymer transporter ExbD [Flaviaesturariibacter amylovorans]|uniref:Biopolymer transporter ExbD n=2 Tax=Flaviaesturariibacter amylovorans TaxID=1084520 RepID=A0ABP8HB53_9BACT